MAMTLNEMFTFVRTHVDADTTDAPDSTLTVYARIAYNDILSRRDSWPHMEVTYTFNTISNQSDYPFTSFLPSGDLEVVSAVIDRSQLSRRLAWMSQGDADLAFGSSSTLVSKQAYGWCVKGNNTLVLFPTPNDGGKPYTVRGYRTPAVWPTSAGSVPDLPGTLHEMIAIFMIAQYYLAQEDAPLAQFYLGEYDRMAENFAKGEVTMNNKARPMIMGGQQKFGSTFMDRARGAAE